MAKIVCVLYDDPVDGYPTEYARDGVPRIETIPVVRPFLLRRDRLHARRAPRELSGGWDCVPISRPRSHVRRDLGQGGAELHLRPGAARRRRRDLATVLAGLPDRRADRRGTEPQARDHRRDRLGPRGPAGRHRPRCHGRGGDVLEQHQRVRARRDDDPVVGAQLIPSYQWVVKGGWNIADCVQRSYDLEGMTMRTCARGRSVRGPGSSSTHFDVTLHITDDDELNEMKLINFLNKEVHRPCSAPPPESARALPPGNRKRISKPPVLSAVRPAHGLDRAHTHSNLVEIVMTQNHRSPCQSARALRGQ